MADRFPAAPASAKKKPAEAGLVSRGGLEQAYRLLAGASLCWEAVKRALLR